MLLTVIIPCFNEQAVIAETNKRIIEQISSYIDYEVIYVNDGSSDGTLSMLIEFTRNNERIKVVNLSRNFGHQIAVSAGLDRAVGEAIVIIDADLQDPPELIHEFIKRWKEGNHVVYGRRIKRHGETIFKNGSALLYYRILNYLSEVEIPKDVGDFRLIDRRVLNALRTMPERQRLLRGMISWVGFRQFAVDYERPPRFAGETKYPLKRMMKLAVDGILSFSVAPLRAAIWLGSLTASMAALGIIYALVLRFTTRMWVEGFTLQIVSTFFIGGVQLIFLGVIGEYIGRIFTEVKGRPMYFVMDEIGFEASHEQCSTKNYNAN